MKKITNILFMMLLSAGFVFGQSEVDALRYSREDLYGTARSMGMAGAFGALGGDITGVSINPAGIGVYRSSEVVGTLNLSNERSSVGGINNNETTFDMDNLGFVGYFPTRNSVMPVFNFGFSFNRLKSFDRSISATGSPRSTMMDYIADWSAGVKEGNLMMGEDMPDPFYDQPWLSVLGFNSWLMFLDEGTDDRYHATPVPGNAVNRIESKESGYMDNYDFTVGTTIDNVLNLGISLSVKNISYNLRSDYYEDFNNQGGYTMTNWLSSSGAGVGAKFGAIYRPINELRIGLAYHTPFWYSISESYEAQVDDDMGAFVKDLDPEYEKGVVNSGSFSNDYDFRTPGKFVASVATVLGGRFIGSLDYELMNYANMKLSVPSGSGDQRDWYDVDNEYISEDFKPTSTVKVGMEYRFTPSIYGRLGYAWMQNPYKDEFKNSGDAFIPNSNTIYRMEGDANYFTGGMGFRLSRNFFLDMALVYKTQTDELYPFPNLYTEGRQELVIDANPFELKNSSFRGMVTLGYKF
ncbi:MAG: OmpP1/FadL family transporter [Fermentimonas sp.]|jgi:hypothetical protein